MSIKLSIPTTIWLPRYDYLAAWHWAKSIDGFYGISFVHWGLYFLLPHLWVLKFPIIDDITCELYWRGCIAKLYFTTWHLVYSATMYMKIFLNLMQTTVLLLRLFIIVGKSHLRFLFLLHLYFYLMSYLFRLNSW